MANHQVCIGFLALFFLLIGTGVADQTGLDAMAQSLQETELPGRVDEFPAELPMAITMTPRLPSPYRKHQKFFGIEEIRWPGAQVPSSEEAITVVDCYTELTHKHEGKLLLLVNNRQLPHRPCLLRILGHQRVQFLKFNTTDPRTHASVLSGHEMAYMPLKTADVGPRTPLTHYGPFYVACQNGYVEFESYTKNHLESVYLVVEPATSEDFEDNQSTKCETKGGNANWLDRRFSVPVLASDESKDHVNDHVHHTNANWHEFNLPIPKNQDQED